MPDTDPDGNDKRELNTTTLSTEEWFEELNKCDRLHQYAKKQKQEESSEERREEPKEGTTLSQEEWFEELSKHDSFDQYAKRRRERREEETDDE